MFVFPFEHGVDDLVAAAVAGGVRRFVVLSSLAAAGEFPRDIGSASHTRHLVAERAVVASRTDAWTVLRPGTFANNLFSWAWPSRPGCRSVRRYVTGELPDGGQLPLMRLRYSGSAHRWHLATYRAGNNSYEDQYWFSGTTEEALDFVCSVLISPISNWPHPDPDQSTPEGLQN